MLKKLKYPFYAAGFFLVLIAAYSVVHFWTSKDPVWTELKATIESGNLEALKSMIDQDPSLLSKENELRFAPVSVAAESGQLACLEYLLSMGANINHQTTLGTTPLMLAAYRGHFSVVEFLIAQGANIELKSAGGWTALLFAALGGKKGYLNIFEYLLNKGAVFNYSDMASVDVASNLSIFKRPEMMAAIQAYQENHKDRPKHE